MLCQAEGLYVCDYCHWSRVCSVIACACQKRDSLKTAFWLSVVLHRDLLSLDVAKLCRLSPHFWGSILSIHTRGEEWSKWLGVGEAGCNVGEPGDLGTRLPLYSVWLQECTPHSHPNVGSHSLLPHLHGLDGIRRDRSEIKGSKCAKWLGAAFSSLYIAFNQFTKVDLW